MRRLIAGAVLAVASTTATALAGPITLDDIEKYPSVSNVTMSLEGDFIAGVVHNPNTNGMDTAVATWDISGDIDTSKPLVPMAITPGNKRQKLVGASAFMDGKVFVVGSQTFTGANPGCIEGKTTGSEKTFITQFYLSDKTLDNIEPAFEKAMGRVDNNIIKQCMKLASTLTSVASSLPLEDDWIMLNRAEVGEGNKIYRHNIKTGEETFFERAGSRNGWNTALRDPRTYETLAESKVEVEDGDRRIIVRMRHPDTNEWVTAKEASYLLSNRYEIRPVGIDDATGKVYVVTDKFSDKAAVYMYDIRANRFDPEPVFAHPEFSVTNVSFSQRKKNFNQVLGFTYGADVITPLYIEPEIKSVYEGLSAAFPDRNISLNDVNEDMSRVLFTVSASNYPPVHYLLIDKARVALVGATRPWVNSDNLAKTELIYYNARDGLKVPALMTLPKGWKKGDAPLPTIIHPHGGPWVRDYANFNWQVQYFASNGYAVLQPQYRGSTGFGRELWLAGDAEWGQKMQDDKDDGAAWMVSEGIADQDQMAMMGFSYGGFASMAAAVRPNSPYQCSIAGAGVSNLAKLGNRWSNNRLQRIFQGDTVKGMDPIQNVEKANIPILVYHGERDVRVPVFQGRDFYNAIKKYSPQSKWVLIDDMPHGFPWPEHRRESMEIMDKYFRGTCGLKPTAIKTDS